MKIKRLIYNILLSTFLTLVGLGICHADPNIKVKWSIDLKGMLVKYSVTNEDTATIKWSNHVLAFCRQDSNKSIISTLVSNPAYTSDSVIHPYLEIITHLLKGSRLESFGGFMPPPVEIKPGETRDFSCSIADASIFNGNPTDLAQIKSASFQLAYNGNLISKTELNYANGQWKETTP